jgi:hypothetical protein
MYGDSKILRMRDMSYMLPSQNVARKILNDIVAGAQPQLVEGNRGNVVSVGDYDLQLTCMSVKS